MAIQFICSHCRRKLKVADRFAGANIRCPKCREITVAPSPDKPTQTAPLPLSSAIPSGIGETIGEVEPVDLSKRPIEESELDMTPMVDVTFLLLIFFMITAAFSLQKSIEIPKPSDDNTVNPAVVVEPEPGNIIIRIDRENTIWVNDVEAPSEQDLWIKLREAKKGIPGSNSPPINSVLVMADNEALHKYVVMALDACNGADMNEIKLVTADSNEL